MLIEAQGKGELNRVCSHTEGFPFPDECFSRIMMIDALHHVCDQSQTALELMRVLEPGGSIVIEEPNLRNFGVKLVALAEKLALMRSHFLYPYEIASLFDMPQTNVNINDDLDGFNAWVIIKKII